MAKKKKNEAAQEMPQDIPVAQEACDTCVEPVLEDEVLQAEAVEMELAQQLQKAIDERNEYLNMAQRVQADFENYKKRNQTVRADAFEDGKREVLAAVLPVLDNLERALAVEGQEGSAFVAGVEQVAKQVRDMLAKFTVHEIDCLGKPFDPEEASAVMQAPAEEGQEPGTVSEVLQKGYRMGERVLRYAMVKVVADN